MITAGLLNQIAGPLSATRPYGIGEAGWIAVSAAATALAAFVAMVAVAVTGAMAFFTRQLAEKTRDLSTETRDMVKASADERLQAETHHQRSMTPLVVTDAKCNRMSGTQLGFKGLIKNIGPGPALGIFIAIKPDVSVVAEKYLGALPAAAVWDLDVHWTVSETTPHLEAYPYECLITFMSIFVTEGYTKQYSYSGFGEDASLRELVLPADAKTGELAAVKAAFRGPQAIAAFGKMNPRPGT